MTVDVVADAIDRARFYVRAATLADDEVDAAVVDPDLDDAGSALVRAAVVGERAALAADEATWHDATINDRISAAFAELRGRGVVAVEHAGYTMSEGWGIVAEMSEGEPGTHGAVFFHEQDLERGVRGEGLMLAFGSFDDGQSHADKSHALAVDICRTLRRHGVACGWSGDIDRRIDVAPFAWRKRRTTKAPAYALRPDDAASEPQEWAAAPSTKQPSTKTSTKPWWRFW